jgi:hypothetical protein
MKLLAIALLTLLPAGVQDDKNAGEQFQDALAKAKETKRRVFLTFGSPG